MNLLTWLIPVDLEKKIDLKYKFKEKCFNHSEILNSQINIKMHSDYESVI